MARKRFVLGGIEFKSGVAVRSYVREIAARMRLDEPLQGQDHAVVADLLKHHPHADQKIGPGIRSLTFGRGVVNPKERTLYVHRVDGSLVDASWVKCITGEAPVRQQAIAAFRSAIAEQVIDFMQSAFRRGDVCAITGEPLYKGAVNVDHVVPFSELLREFMAQERLAFESVAFTDGFGVGELADEGLRARWQDFHAKRAVLRIMSVEAHKAITKTQFASRTAS